MGITQIQFAKPLGITNFYVSDLEKGRAQRPSEPLLQAIERHYGINRNWLFTGEGEMFVAREGGKGEAALERAHILLDAGLLAEVIAQVEEELEKRERRLPRDKKAHLIALLYELFARTDQKVEQKKVAAYLDLAS